MHYQHSCTHWSLFIGSRSCRLQRPSNGTANYATEPAEHLPEDRRPHGSSCCCYPYSLCLLQAPRWARHGRPLCVISGGGWLLSRQAPHEDGRRPEGPLGLEGGILVLQLSHVRILRDSLQACAPGPLDYQLFPDSRSISPSTVEESNLIPVQTMAGWCSGGAKRKVSGLAVDDLIARLWSDEVEGEA